MSTIGTVDSLWRYPVKSMCGEELDEAYLGFAGVYGDRVFAFKSSASPHGFPYLTGREQQEMLQYRPAFRNPRQAAKPVNLDEAEGIAPGLTPVYADSAGFAVDVLTPSGETLAIDDPDLTRSLENGLGGTHKLRLMRSDRAMTDCRPVSMLSLQTVAQLQNDIGVEMDRRRFRANIYVDLVSGKGFDEDALVGKSLRLGEKAVVRILERDPRCKMITIDPDTGTENADILQHVTQAHDGMAGVYGAVLVEGTVGKGDSIELVA